MSNWQHMDTAPLDGTDILITAKEGVTVGYWYLDEYEKRKTFKKQRWRLSYLPDVGGEEYFNDDLEDPTHWMPLPPEPFREIIVPEGTILI